jgi:RNA polymerase sigma-70 factor (ECF subfamily)
MKATIVSSLRQPTADYASLQKNVGWSSCYTAPRRNVARLVDAYLAARRAGASPETAALDLDELDRTLATVCARGRAAHPDLAVENLVFAAHLGRCGASIKLGTIEGPTASELHAEDLYLCCAGLLGDERAVRTLRDRHRPVIAGYLRTIDASDTLLDEIEQRVWDAALIGTPETPPKLVSYSGKGPLAAWIGVSSQRLVLMMRRSEGAEKRALDTVALEAQVSAADPELAIVKKHLRGPFQRAVLSALAALDDRQRMIYTLHVLDGVTVERIGAIYGVSHSTVSRWMAGARDAIVDHARRVLQDELQLTGEEFDSLARLLASQLDFSVSALLRPRAETT